MAAAVYMGGLSIGPKTAEGIERIRKARTKHGRYSAAAKAEEAKYLEAREAFRALKARMLGLIETSDL